MLELSLKSVRFDCMMPTFGKTKINELSHERCSWLQLKAFEPTQEFFVGIDSDGCVFDSMEIT